MNRRLGWCTDGAAVAVLLCNATNAALVNGYRVYRSAVTREAERTGDRTRAWVGRAAKISSHQSASSGCTLTDSNTLAPLPAPRTLLRFPRAPRAQGLECAGQGQPPGDLGRLRLARGAVGLGPVPDPRAAGRRHDLVSGVEGGARRAFDRGKLLMALPVPPPNNTACAGCVTHVVKLDERFPSRRCLWHWPRSDGTGWL